MTRNELACEVVSRAAIQLNSVHSRIVWLSRLIMLAPVIGVLFAAIAQHFGANDIVVVVGIFVILETTRRYCSYKQGVLRSAIQTIGNSCEFRIASCMTVQIGSKFECHIKTECNELIIVESPNLREIKWLFVGLAGFRFCYPFSINSVRLPQKITQKIRASICDKKYWCLCTAVATLDENIDLAQILRLYPQGISPVQVQHEVGESTRRAVQQHARAYPDEQLGKMEDELVSQSLELQLWPYTVRFHTVDVKYAKNTRAAA